MGNTKPQPGAWVIVALLFGFMMINFIDKAIIGIAGIPIMKDLGLTPKQFGLVNSAFFFLFSVSGLVMGFLVNRVQARWVLLAMVSIWSLVQFPMLGSVSFGGLIAARMALGAGEGGSFPIALHAAYKWFPNRLRMLPTAIISQGASVGVVIALPLLELLIEETSWHAAFGALGVLGLLWVAAWLKWGKEGSLADTPTVVAAVPQARIAYRKLIFNRTTIAVLLSGFGGNWALALLVGWFPPFLIQGLHFTPKEASWLTTVPWLVSPVVVIGASWLSQHMLARQFTTRAARGLMAGICVTAGGIAMIALRQMPSPALQITMMVTSLALLSVTFGMGHAMLSEYTPTAQRGLMLAINNAFATTAGMIGPYLMGSVLQDALASGATAAQGYGLGYQICGIVCLVVGINGIINLRPNAEVARLVIP